jgi:hypothetical protein
MSSSSAHGMDCTNAQSFLILSLHKLDQSCLTAALLITQQWLSVKLNL